LTKIAVAQASLAAAAPDHPRFYSPQLDGLRFLAALLVFIHHAPEVPALSLIKPNGWAGVDMFLAISAFLITRLILLEQNRTGTFSLRSFYIRRALRIWPLYLSYASVACVVTLIAGFLPSRLVLAWWLSHISFTNNVMTAIKGYSPIAFSSHLWTISLEEQAYLLIPLLLSAFILGGARNKHAILFCLGGIIALVIARLGLVIAQTPHPVIWVLPLRSDAFLLGSLAAILTRDRKHVPATLLCVVGSLLVATVPFFPPIDKPGLYQVVGYTVLASGCSCIVVACVHSDMARKALGISPLRYLGKISYGIYVYHLAAIFVATKLIQHFAVYSDALAFVGGLAITILTAAISYQVLERPFLILKLRYARVASRPT
jgi:peptidoglycan/LPS O-acetylase OafA/YrhL